MKSRIAIAAAAMRAASVAAPAFAGEAQLRSAARKPPQRNSCRIRA
jgi:hypothetical protein